MSGCHLIAPSPWGNPWLDEVDENVDMVVLEDTLLANSDEAAAVVTAVWS